MRWDVQTVIVHLKYIFDGKTTYNLVPWGVVGCCVVLWGAVGCRGVIISTSSTRYFNLFDFLTELRTFSLEIRNVVSSEGDFFFNGVEFKYFRLNSF